MNYIYDILANFNSCYYDFYDWNDDDNIVHIKKLIVIKVDTDFFNMVKYHDVLVDHNLLDKIYKKTDFFKLNKDKFNYVCALCDGREAFIVNFDCNGRVISRSSLLVDEENEIIDICDCVDVLDYSVSLNSFCSYDFFKTRKEFFVSQLFLNELKVMGDDKLKYLYFECFNERENNVDIIVDKISVEFKDNFDRIYDKIYSFLKLTSM